MAFFSPFYIGDGRIASSMAVYHSTIFCYLTLLERSNTLIPDALSDDTASFGESRTEDISLEVRYANSTLRRFQS